MVNSQSAALQFSSYMAGASISQVSVSVVIPCYRCSKTIGRALASVAAQKMLPKEVILVEDASPDDGETLRTLYEQAAKYADSFEVKLIFLNENVGAASARNLGWLAASQTYIAFLDADDAWHPEKLKIQLSWMMNNPEIGITGHFHIVLDENVDFRFSLLSEFPAVKPVRKFYPLLSNPYSTTSVILKRTIPFRFKEGKRYAEDYQLWLEIILANIPAAFVSSPLAATFKEIYGSGGLSAHLWKMEKGELDTYWQIYKCRKIGFLLTIFLCLYSLVKYIKRFILVTMRLYI